MSFFARLARLFLGSFRRLAALFGWRPGIECSGCGESFSTEAYARHAGIRVRGREFRCRFCHTWVPLEQLGPHEAVHLEKGPDGQRRDHISLPPDERYEGPLDDVPRRYEHDACGARTGMPEFIVRTYLVDPFFYSERTFCTGCQDYVHMSELAWVETGENLLEYQRGLKRAWELANGPPPCRG